MATACARHILVATKEACEELKTQIEADAGGADAHVISYRDFADTFEYFSSDGAPSVRRRSVRPLDEKE